MAEEPAGTQDGRTRCLLRRRAPAVALGIGLMVLLALRLRPAPVVEYCSPDRKEIVLTLDTEGDCDHAVEKLDILKQYHVRATFFVTGQWVENWPDLMKRLVHDGHEASGNHSFSHPQMTRISAPAIWSELGRTDRLIRRATGKRPLYLRPPYGDSDKRVRLIAQAFGYRMIFWSVDPRDWSKPGADRIVECVLKEASPGSIVLLHLSAEHTDEALPRIIEGLRARGYRLVTLSEALRPL